MVMLGLLSGTMLITPISQAENITMTVEDDSLQQLNISGTLCNQIKVSSIAEPFLPGEKLSFCRGSDIRIHFVGGQTKLKPAVANNELIQCRGALGYYKCSMA